MLRPHETHADHVCCRRLLGEDGGVQITHIIHVKHSTGKYEYEGRWNDGVSLEEEEGEEQQQQGE